MQNRYFCAHKHLGNNWVWSRTGSFNGIPGVHERQKKYGKQLQQPISVTIPFFFFLMSIQCSSRGSFPGDLRIEIANSRGQIGWKKTHLWSLSDLSSRCAVPVPGLQGTLSHCKPAAHPPVQGDKVIPKGLWEESEDLLGGRELTLLLA